MEWLIVVVIVFVFAVPILDTDVKDCGKCKCGGRLIYRKGTTTKFPSISCNKCKRGLRGQ